MPLFDAGSCRSSRLRALLVKTWSPAISQSVLPRGASFARVVRPRSDLAAATTAILNCARSIATTRRVRACVPSCRASHESSSPPSHAPGIQQMPDYYPRSRRRILLFTISAILDYDLGPIGGTAGRRRLRTSGRGGARPPVPAWRLL